MSSNHKFDTVGFLTDYEQGNVTADELIEGFQYLIDSGNMHGLEPHYHRVANHLIQEGLCHD